MFFKDIFRFSKDSYKDKLSFFGGYLTSHVFSFSEAGMWNNASRMRKTSSPSFYSAFRQYRHNTSETFVIRINPESALIMGVISTNHPVLSYPVLSKKKVGRKDGSGQELSFHEIRSIYFVTGPYFSVTCSDDRKQARDEGILVPISDATNLLHNWLSI